MWGGNRRAVEDFLRQVPAEEDETRPGGETGESRIRDEEGRV